MPTNNLEPIFQGVPARIKSAHIPRDAVEEVFSAYVLVEVLLPCHLHNLKPRSPAAGLEGTRVRFDPERSHAHAKASVSPAVCDCTSRGKIEVSGLDCTRIRRQHRRLRESVIGAPLAALRELRNDCVVDGVGISRSVAQFDAVGLEGFQIPRSWPRCRRREVVSLLVALRPVYHLGDGHDVASITPTKRC